MGCNKVTAVVLAAGRGKRMGTDVPKQYLKIRGHEILYYSLKAFEESVVDEVVLVTGEQDIEYCQKEIVEKYGFEKVAKIIPGGAERYDSVYAGLLAADDCSYVLIHDGARPLVTPEIIAKVLEGAMAYDSCTTGMPVKDTIKVVDEDNMAVDTPERGALWTIHTPQGFSYPVILEAHRKFRQGDYRIPVTDDTMLAEIFLRKRAKLVEGSYQNIKVTTPEDIDAAEAFYTKRKKKDDSFKTMEKEELGMLSGWFSDEESFSKWSAGKFSYPLTEEQLFEYYERFEKDKNGWIFAALDEKGKLVGHIMMRNADYENQSIHFGFIVVSPEARGKGTGRGMLLQALKYAGQILGMKRATLGVFENNPAARHCYESVGFKAEKTENAAYRYKGEPWNVIHMAAECPMDETGGAES